jgi:hypothetical protein
MSKTDCALRRIIGIGRVRSPRVSKGDAPVGQPAWSDKVFAAWSFVLTPDLSRELEMISVFRDSSCDFSE